MIPDKIVVPHFANESDEADWWFDNREEHDKIMAKAIKEGRTLTLKQVLERHKIPTDVPVQIALDLDDVGRARIQAKSRGIHYQDYMRDLLHQALLSNDSADAR